MAQASKLLGTLHLAGGRSRGALAVNSSIVAPTVAGVLGIVLDALHAGLGKGVDE